MLVLFGIIDLGRLINAKMTLSQAAADGARAAAIGVDPEDVTKRIDAVLGSMAAGTTIPTIGQCDGTAGADITLTLSYDFSYVTPLLGSATTLTATAVVPCM
jgi:Flp pilus assembly protein TadG